MEKKLSKVEIFHPLSTLMENVKKAHVDSMCDNRCGKIELEFQSRRIQNKVFL